MLKCFGMVGLARLQSPLVEFLIIETFANKTLSSCQRSCRMFWLPSVTDDQERLQLERFMKRLIQHYWMLQCDMHNCAFFIFFFVLLGNNITSISHVVITMLRACYFRPIGLFRWARVVLWRCCITVVLIITVTYCRGHHQTLLCDEKLISRLVH